MAAQVRAHLGNIRKTITIAGARTVCWLHVVRSENWWFAKIPPLLAVMYLEIARLGGEPRHAILMLVGFLCSISCVAAYGHVINDVFDVEADLRAGRSNRMAGVSTTQRAALCLALLLAGFVASVLAHFPVSTLVLLALNYLWPTIYSVPGARLKERGAAGLICDALGSHVTPTLIALSMFEMTLPRGTGQSSTGAMTTFFPVAITAWAAVLGLKGILHHQILDRANDMRSGTVTFATKLRPEGISRFLGAFNLYLELPVSFVVALSTLEWAPFVAAAFAVYCLLESIKYRLGFEFALTSEAWTVRRSVPFTNESFYTFWLPLAAALQLAFSDRIWIWVPIVQLVLFCRNVVEQVSEIIAVIRVADLPNRLARWMH
jgi:4-hydroxybenzoate polyprenyltransferase